MNDELPPTDDRPECQACITFLNAYLDGDQPTISADVLKHRQECATCRDEWAMAAYFSTQTRATTVPPAVHTAVYQAVSRDQTKRLWWRRVGWGSFPVAACLGLAVYVALQAKPIAPAVGVAMVVEHATEIKPPRPKEDSLTEMRVAMANFTQKMLPDEPPAILETEPLIKLPTIQPWPETPATVTSLSSASDGLKSGVQPMATTAKRAMSMLFRATDSFTKPKSNMKVQ